MRLAILLLAVVATAAATQAQDAQRVNSAAERESAISQAIAEAKAHNRKYSLSKLIKSGGGYSKPTKEAIKEGEARLMYEDMVFRAERRLAEMNRKSAGIQSAETRAEELARELFHKPGSQLTKEELARMWQESECVGIREVPECLTMMAYLYRTMDGSCNNLDNPLWGASLMPFKRLLPAHYENGINSLRGALQARGEDVLPIDKFAPPYPSPRYVSYQISRNISKPENHFTHLFMEWGHFHDHDMTRAPRPEAKDVCNKDCTFTDVCEPMFVPKDDPSFGEGTRLDGNCLVYARSIPACDVSHPGEFLPRETVNELTSYIDGSNVYGSTDEISGWIRAHEGGLLLEGVDFPDDLVSLPRDTHDYMTCGDQTNCYLAGDGRANENTGLLSVHVIWFREHNRIARELSEINPSWDDDKLFHEARKIVGALMEKISFEDYLPKVLGPEVYDQVIRPYNGYDDSVNPTINHGFAAAAFRWGHTLVRPWYSRLDSDYLPLPMGPFNLKDAFFNPPLYEESEGTDPVLRGLLTDNSNHVDEFLNYVLTTQLFETNVTIGNDLAARNMQRARDHGIPPYLTYQRFCHSEFNFLYDSVFPEFENELTHVHFLQSYGSLDTVDFYLAGLGEKRLHGSLVGPTIACLIGLTFSNLRDGDRFYYENPDVFTPSQLAEIKKGTFSRVICDNTHIDRIQRDAFLSNQSRISCDLLPSVDLEKWAEALPLCYARVEVVAHTEPILVQISSRSIQQQFTFFSHHFSHSQTGTAQCMPVACATAAKDTEVLVMTMSNSVSVTSNAELTPNQLQQKNRYRGKWPQKNFIQQRSGIFLTKAACTESPHAGLTFSMRNDQQSLNTMQQLELALQKETGSEENEKAELRADLESFFGVKDKGSRVASKSTGTAEAEKLASDQELASELEQALQDLA